MREAMIFPRGSFSFRPVSGRAPLGPILPIFKPLKTKRPRRRLLGLLIVMVPVIA